MKRLLEKRTELRFDHCYEELRGLVQAKTEQLASGGGLEKRLREQFEALPWVIPSTMDLSADWVRIGEADDLLGDDRRELKALLKRFQPWRKGPFELFGIRIDTEWASQVKWNRIKNRIGSLSGRRVLDIGCSSGYYMFRMKEENPRMVLGIDPFIPFYYQYRIFQHYAGVPDLYHLPVKLEEMPPFKEYFDTVFCMGIIYHRKSPVDTLRQIRTMMPEGGELVIETLIIEGDSETALFPVDRYAKMRNVFFIPTVPCLSNWLKRAGFDHVHCIDTSPTTLGEQRKTEWVETESLADFLDPADPSLTVEGYPAPVRSVVTAKAV